MKSTYVLATLAGFFIANTPVTASAFDSSVEDKISALSREFEERFYQTKSKKEKKRDRDQLLLNVVERKAALAALTAEITRKKRQAKKLKFILQN